MILYSAVQTVCRCVSARHLSAGRCGAALAWAVRARSPHTAARAAHRALKQYCESTERDVRELPAVDLLLTAGVNMLMDDTLLFLGKILKVTQQHNPFTHIPGVDQEIS